MLIASQQWNCCGNKLIQFPVLEYQNTVLIYKLRILKMSMEI